MSDVARIPISVGFGSGTHSVLQSPLRLGRSNREVILFQFGERSLLLWHLVWRCRRSRGCAWWLRLAEKCVRFGEDFV